MGLSGLFGFGKKKTPNVTAAPTVTSPAPPSLVSPVAPPSVIKQTSDAEIAGRQAAARTRKRAGAGALPSRPQATGSILAPTNTPKTLLGY